MCDYQEIFAQVLVSSLSKSEEPTILLKEISQNIHHVESGK